MQPGRQRRMKWSTPHSASSSTSSRISGPAWRESTGFLLPRVKQGRAMEAGAEVRLGLEATMATIDVEEEEEEVEVEEAEEVLTEVFIMGGVIFITEAVSRIFVTGLPSRDMEVTMI